MTFYRAKFDSIYVFRYEESEFEVLFETGSKINGVSQFLRMRSTKITKNSENDPKMQV